MIEVNSDTSKERVEDLLKDKAWLIDKRESIDQISVPGEGNMNVVLRIETNMRSIILKQSRPYVQKYPSIPAPLDRIDVEYQFYKSLQGQPISNHLPEVIAYDSTDHLLLMQDLGKVSDMTRLYSDQHFDANDLQVLVEVLSGVHSIAVSSQYPENLALRRLNHQHIFVLPFMEDNGFDLDDVQPGLQVLSKHYKEDQKLKSTISKIGELYLNSGDVLLHGDYYPGSWMKVDEEVFVLDPEFSFVGFREFDLGVMIAHLLIATNDLDIIGQALDQYQPSYDLKLVKQIAGIEITRRIIGLAQLPLERSIEEKKDLLDMAYSLII